MTKQCAITVELIRASRRQSGFALLLVLLVNALLVAALLAGWQLQQNSARNSQLLHTAYQQRLDQLSLINAVRNQLATSELTSTSVCLAADGTLQLACSSDSAQLTKLDTNASFADGSSGYSYQLETEQLIVQLVTSQSRTEILSQHHQP